MFRNPRENALPGLRTTILPSTGRPPSPSYNGDHSARQNHSPYFGESATPTPGLARIATKDLVALGSPSSRRTSVTKKAPAKNVSGKSRASRPNQSILNYFGKTAQICTTEGHSAPQDAELFFEETTKPLSTPIEDWRRDRSASPGFFVGHEGMNGTGYQGHEECFDQSIDAVKRRKLQGDTDDAWSVSGGTILDARFLSGHASSPAEGAKSHKSVRQVGGFVDDSSDEEEIAHEYVLAPEHEKVNETVDTGEVSLLHGGTRTPNACVKIVSESQGQDAYQNEPLSSQEPNNPKIEDIDEDDIPNSLIPSRPSLQRESTSRYGVDEFSGLDDFDDEFFEGGEEFMERKWMEEQRMLEEGLDEDSKSESGEESVVTPNAGVTVAAAAGRGDAMACCPVCYTHLQGFTETQASTHVNACLDANPTPMPALHDTDTGNIKKEAFTNASMPRRFQRAAVARPGQENPFGPTQDGKSGSVFSRLMSGHAEDAAWAAAAANENASRGKPAYQRTCPFYKILPGFYIAVDAFRYGNVQGQNAYFLSHFHSDHYIGLTSSWCHGPIYCSKVTANLVRQQLRVDPKWVVALEFEKKVEVPNTKGVFVTMIPANHCPGSSLYLFEKRISNGPKGPKMNRVLHCGDFRACPAHITHPLLMPDVVDVLTGQTKQQWIDTCYLDTTYLTPKYAFPSQEDVIGSCAEMCVSLSKDVVDTSDSWEKAKADRAGCTMTKFLERTTSEDAIIKPDEDVKPTTRGRLLVVIGTYSIGKERICLGIAQALKSKIYAPPSKMKICACLEDPELSALLTPHPLEAQVHMQTLMEIRAETLHEYLQTYQGHFSRVVGFRPTGWNYRPPSGRNADNPAVATVLHNEGWKSHFTMRDLVPQRGSTKESNCFGVPYSEHSSFRELTMFCCALRIGRVIPTVNVGSAKSREKMKAWIERWEVERKKNGLFNIDQGKW